MFERCRSHAKERGCASMSRVPNVKDSLTRINEEIERRSNPRDRTMLEIYRDHWWAEVNNDVDAIMATLPKDKVTYLFDGLGSMLQIGRGKSRESGCM